MKISISIIIVFFAINCNAQLFEGKINYVGTLYSNIQSEPIANCTFIYIKENNIKFISGCNNNFHYMLRIGEKEYYIDDLEEINRQNITDINAFRDDNINPKAFKKLKGKEKVLGYDCTKYKLVRKSNYNETTIFWIADSIKVNNYLGYFILNDFGVVLKLTSEYEFGTKFLEVKEISAMKLEDKLFELPDYPIKEVDFEKLSKQYIKETGH